MLVQDFFKKKPQSFRTEKTYPDINDIKLYYSRSAVSAD